MKDNIEQFIDKNGLISLLGAIEDICEAKAGHIIESYNDKELAKQWDKAVLLIIRAKNGIEKLGIG